MSGNTRRVWIYGAMALLVALAAGVDAASDAAAAADDERASGTEAAAKGVTETDAAGSERVQSSAEGYVRDREPGTLRDILTLKSTRSVKREAPASGEKGTAGTRSLAVQYGDDWVYGAGTDLLLDADADGYYRYLRVHFDVDSIFDRAYVYARLYTSPDGESWDFYYETDDFLVTGSTPDDAYEVESELIDNYPPGLYDVLVEIYDADTGTLVDEFGPDESSAFSLLPLEDAADDNVPP
ncbi:MAG TPA: choice-of-anchor H family protein, partial [Gammaproteobacteria bacterium]|nr:choice-of-anchor H family protein [Gammaproteobacteria bacterium]